VTLYLGAARSTPLIQDILTASPGRIIFNPGAENPELAKAASSAGIENREWLHSRHVGGWEFLICSPRVKLLPASSCESSSRYFFC